MIRRILKSSFNATHAVVLPQGREAVHGHDWRVRFECDIKGESVIPEDLAKALERTLAPLRHKHLNDIEVLKQYEATAESVAQYIFGKLERELAGMPVKPFAVELEEEPGCRARYEAR